MIAPKIDPNSYFKLYTDLVPHGDILKTLRRQRKKMKRILLSPDIDLNYAYATGKWTVAQSMIHLIDTERIFCYRALCIARGEQGALPGMDQDVYADNDFSHLTLEQILKYYLSTRKATIQFFSMLTEKEQGRSGTVSDYITTPVTNAHIIAGHERHHFKIFKEKYNLDI